MTIKRRYVVVRDPETSPSVVTKDDYGKKSTWMVHDKGNIYFHDTPADAARLHEQMGGDISGWYIAVVGWEVPND